MRVIHRQKPKVGGVGGRQVPDDTARSVAVDIETEIGVLRHLGQIERGVIRKARREVQVRTGIDPEVAERRDVLVDRCVVWKLPLVGNALIVGHSKLWDAGYQREQIVPAKRDGGRDRQQGQGALCPEAYEPEQTAGKPEE